MILLRRQVQELQQNNRDEEQINQQLMLIPSMVEAKDRQLQENQHTN